MQSPLYPTAPPTKKQRSNDGARVMNGAGNHSNGGSSAADALTRRRVALEKLRRQQARPIANPNDLLAKARGQLKGTPPYMNGSGPPPTLNGTGPPPTTSSSSAFPPPMPSPSNPKNLIKRTSDIFPHVEKVPQQTRAPSSSARGASSARAQRPPVVTIPAFKSEKKKTAPVSVPPVSAPPVSSSSRPPRSTSSVPRAPSPSVANATVPPPVAPTPTADAAIIARRLDFAASNDRSKSAPPVRPPPPPPTPPQSAEAPPLGQHLPKAPPTPPATGTTVSLSPTASLSPPLTSVVNDAHRPSPITPTLETDAQPSRREFLTSMRQYVDSPSSSKTKNSELELLKELKMVNRDKEDAFRQVVRLRQQVSKLQTTDRKKEEFQALVEIADQDGERAALKWAREQVPEQSKSKTSFMFQSPFKTRSASPSRRALTPAIGVGVRKRVATPHPKRKGVGSEVDTKYLSMATDANPDEFDSELATYVVRRPYAPHHNADFWTDVGELSIDDYSSKTTALVSESLEICAKIKLDGSILMLSGKSNVRHKKPRSSKWKRFDNVDENDVLGSVMFIDEQANEGEYWLDEIYEQAMSTRDTYCSSLLATATALKSNIVQQQVQPMMQQQVQQPPMMQQQQPPNFNNIAPSNGGEKPPGLLPVPSNETIQPQTMQPQQAPPQAAASMPPMMPAAASVPPSQQQQQPQMQQQPLKLGAPNETAIPKDENKDVAAKVKEKKPEEKKEEKKKIKKKKAPPPPDDEDEGASDILSVMLGSIFLAVFNFMHYILVKLPVQILVATFIATVAGIAWALLWLVFANDGGAGEMGAHLGYGFNQAGIQ